ncbi:MAG: prepilin-type N-terminal cleavage/methylation domain-containing protein [Syntrophotaleaceae bacterium]
MAIPQTSWRSVRKTKSAHTPGCQGFTLLEIIIVTAIVGILAAIAIPAFSNYRDKAIMQRCCIELRNLERAITAYLADHEELPDTLAEVQTSLPLDPWGTPYQYLRIAGAEIKGKGELRRDKWLNPLNADFDLYSMGPDRKTQNQLTAKFARDDIIRANSGAYVGIASGY